MSKANCLYDDAISIFEISNKQFMKNNAALFYNNISERTLCGSLMLELYKTINGKFKNYSGYYVDVEYNRAQNGEVKHCIKTINGTEERNIKINCDLIVHGRGNKDVITENLIAIEMKKSTGRKNDKKKDKERLQALTASSDAVYSWNGFIDFKTVCDYILGVYYEINLNRMTVEVEYYRYGECSRTYTMPIINSKKF